MRFRTNVNDVINRHLSSAHSMLRLPPWQKLPRFSTVTVVLATELFLQRLFLHPDPGVYNLHLPSDQEETDAACSESLYRVRRGMNPERGSEEACRPPSRLDGELVQERKVQRTGRGGSTKYETDTHKNQSGVRGVSEEVVWKGTSD